MNNNISSPKEMSSLNVDSSLLPEEQFLCSICLDVFNEPVSTSCGHNFCIACVTKYWDSNDLCQCPLCKETFYTRPELRVNTTFREVVENVKRMTDEGKDDCPANPGKVACDVCTGTKLKALKSCLVCLASYSPGSSSDSPTLKETQTD